MIHIVINIGNPGSLCVTRDITQVNYREHMRRSLGLKICWKMEIKIVETYHVASFCCPLYVQVVFGKSSLHHLSFTLLWRKGDEDYFSQKLLVRIKDNKNSPHGKFQRFLFPFSSKFSDLNFASYVLYNLPVLCHVSHTVSLGYLWSKCKPSCSKSLSLVLIHRKISKIQPFENVKINKEMHDHPDAVRHSVSSLVCWNLSGLLSSKCRGKPLICKTVE